MIRRYNVVSNRDFLLKSCVNVGNKVILLGQKMSEEITE
jgi:hypothetical protein